MEKERWDYFSSCKPNTTQKNSNDSQGTHVKKSSGLILIIEIRLVQKIFRRVIKNKAIKNFSYQSSQFKVFFFRIKNSNRLPDLLTREPNECSIARARCWSLAKI